MMFRPLPTAILLAAGLALSPALASAQAQAPAQTPTPHPTWPSSAPMPVAPTVLLDTQTTWEGKPLAYPAGTPRVTALHIAVAPGAQTGWHHHPVPSLAYIIEGELEVALKDGTVKRLKAGEAVAEGVGTVHNGRNPGAVPTRLVVFYVGAQDLPLTVPEQR